MNFRSILLALTFALSSGVATAARVEIIDGDNVDAVFDPAEVEMRASREGNYLSLTVTINATSREQLDALYRELTSHPMVAMVL
mgnify:CR=1 FL=1